MPYLHRSTKFTILAGDTSARRFLSAIAKIFHYCASDAIMPCFSDVCVIYYRLQAIVPRLLRLDAWQSTRNDIYDDARPPTFHYHDARRLQEAGPAHATSRCLDGVDFHLVAASVFVAFRADGLSTIEHFITPPHIAARYQD